MIWPSMGSGNEAASLLGADRVKQKRGFDLTVSCAAIIVGLREAHPLHEGGVTMCNYSCLSEACRGFLSVGERTDRSLAKWPCDACNGDAYRRALIPRFTRY